MTLRDYFYEKPNLSLEDVATGGTDVEQGVEVYEAQGGFRTPDAGKSRAAARLESLRADAVTVAFETNALALAPGMRVKLELAAGYAGAATRARREPRGCCRTGGAGTGLVAVNLRRGELVNTEGRDRGRRSH